MTEVADSPATPVTAPSPAQMLAARRAELGLSLEDVAHQLKFAARQIEALEAGDFDKLPGGTFARGMVRGYARLLKLEPAPILAQLAASGAAPQIAPEQAVSLRTPIPFSEGGKHVNLVYAVLSVVILAVVAFFAMEWYQEKNGTAKLADGSTAVSTAVSAARDVPAAGGASAANDTPAAREAPMKDTTPRAEERRSTHLPAGKRRIVMRFDKESWVEVKAGNGATLISQVNPAGSEKVIEGDPPFSLIIGNAANVRVTYNEQPVDLRPYSKVDVARLKLD